MIRKLLRIVLALLLILGVAVAVVVWRASVWLQTPIEGLHAVSTFEVERVRHYGQWPSSSTHGDGSIGRRHGSCGRV